MKLFTSFGRDRMVFALACLAAVAIMLMSEGVYFQSVSSQDEVGESRLSQHNVQTLMKSMVDAENWTRGFLLTGDRGYLEPYERALREIAGALSRLERHFAADADSTAVLGKLRDISQTRLSELALTIRLIGQGKVEATSEMVKSGIGRETMDEIQAISGTLLEREERNIARGREEVYRNLLLSRIGIIVLSAAGLLTLFMYQRQTKALELQQLEQQRLVQAERDRFEVEVIERTAQLTELTHHIQTAREDERQRLARNLHDDLGALLTSAKLDAARIKSRIAATAPEALELLAHLVGTINAGIALGRRIIEDLRPSALGNLGLAPTLEILAREFAENTGVPVHCTLEPVELEASSELTAYRLVQEAITNIAKYAKAHQVWIGLATRNGLVEVSVRDDGVGFEPNAKRSSAYGLVGMRFRVEASGGRLSLTSSPGNGTLVKATLPCRIASPAEQAGPDSV